MSEDVNYKVGIGFEIDEEELLEKLQYAENKANEMISRVSKDSFKKMFEGKKAEKNLKEIFSEQKITDAIMSGVTGLLKDQISGLIDRTPSTDNIEKGIIRAIDERFKRQEESLSNIGKNLKVPPAQLDLRKMLTGAGRETKDLNKQIDSLNKLMKLLDKDLNKMMKKNYKSIEAGKSSSSRGLDITGALTEKLERLVRGMTSAVGFADMLSKQGQPIPPQTPLREAVKRLPETKEKAETKLPSPRTQDAAVLLSLSSLQGRITERLNSLDHSTNKLDNNVDSILKAVNLDRTTNVFMSRMHESEEKLKRYFKEAVKPTAGSQTDTTRDTTGSLPQVPLSGGSSIELLRNDIKSLRSKIIGLELTISKGFSFKED